MNVDNVMLLEGGIPVDSFKLGDTWDHDTINKIDIPYA